jgi:hypothetical protein
MDGIYLARDVRAFHITLTIQCREPEQEIHGLVATHTSRFVMFVLHVK